MNHGGDKVHAAGIGAGLHQNGVYIALDHTGNQGPQNFAGAVFRGIGQEGKVHPFQNQQPQGKHHHVYHAADGHGLADLHIAPDSQRHVDQQTQVAHPDTGDVLDHGADAVDAGGSKLVGEHEQLIVQGCQHCHEGDDEIGPYLFQISHEFSPEKRTISGFFPVL